MKKQILLGVAFLFSFGVINIQTIPGKAYYGEGNCWIQYGVGTELVRINDSDGCKKAFAQYQQQQQDQYNQELAQMKKYNPEQYKKCMAGNQCFCPGGCPE